MLAHLRFLLVCSSCSLISYVTASSETEHGCAQEASRHCLVAQGVFFLVDSSASVGEQEFAEAKAFLIDVHEKLEVPPIRSGIVRFNHEFDIISMLSSNKSALVNSVQNMTYNPGETLLAPPLSAAQSLLLAEYFEHRTIIVITDGDPNDKQDTRDRAAVLSGNGIRLVFVEVGNAKMNLVEEIAVEDQIIRVDSYSMLSSATGRLLGFLHVPCPCSADLVAPFHIGMFSGEVTLNETLPHDQTNSMQCTDIGMDGSYSGMMNLTCNNGTLLVQHSCVRRCPAGLSVVVSYESSFFGAKFEAPEGGLDSGALLLHQCKDHFAGTTGGIGLGCFDGELRGVANCIPAKEAECTEEVSQGVPFFIIPVACVASAFITAAVMYLIVRKRLKHKPWKKKTLAKARKSLGKDRAIQMNNVRGLPRLDSSNTFLDQMSNVKGSNVEGLRAGDTVYLCGLQTAQELNGCGGVLGTFDPESGRWSVHLSDGQTKNVKLVNLCRHAPFAIVDAENLGNPRGVFATDSDRAVRPRDITLKETPVRGGVVSAVVDTAIRSWDRGHGRAEQE